MTPVTETPGKPKRNHKEWSSSRRVVNSSPICTPGKCERILTKAVFPSRGQHIHEKMKAGACSAVATRAGFETDSRISAIIRSRHGLSCQPHDVQSRGLSEIQASPVASSPILPALDRPDVRHRCPQILRELFRRRWSQSAVNTPLLIMLEHGALAYGGIRVTHKALLHKALHRGGELSTGSSERPLA